MGMSPLSPGGLGRQLAASKAVMSAAIAKNGALWEAVFLMQLSIWATGVARLYHTVRALIHRFRRLHTGNLCNLRMRFVVVCGRCSCGKPLLCCWLRLFFSLSHLVNNKLLQTLDHAGRNRFGRRRPPTRRSFPDQH